MTSLRAILNKEIRERGYLSVNEVEVLCKRENHKMSNAERRLRHSESPNVEPVKNDKGAIVGYKYLPPNLAPANFPQEEPMKPKDFEVNTLFPYPKFNESAARWRE